MSRLKEDVLKLKATVEFGSEYTYILKYGGLGLTLVVSTETKKEARIARQKIPMRWEDLYVIVTYSSSDVEEEALESCSSDLELM